MAHARFTKGNILLLALVFAGIFIAAGTALIGSMNTYGRAERTTVAAAQALALAEGALSQAVYQLNQNASYSGETNTALGAGMFTVAVSTIDAQTRRITVTASVPDSTNPVATKTIKANVGIDNSVISFHYGVQAGAGGFLLSGGSTINGSAYSNGDIDATSGVHITGSAVAANPPALSTDQANDTPTPIASCTSSTCITFANAAATQDVAQSFTISTATSLNNMQFYIKKVSTPANITVRIVNDASGKPGTDVLMTGTLAASNITTSFGWVSVPLPSTPVLDPSQTYWVVLDAGSNSSKYYVIGGNAGGYAGGVANIGAYGGSWSSTTPSGLDTYFRIFLGGGTSMIGGNSYATGVYVGTTASDDAWAHTIMGATVTGTIYCQAGSYTNKACVTTRPDPTPQPMPLSDGQITEWKNDALAGGTQTGNVAIGWQGATLGPRKIVGNVSVSGGGTLTVTGTLWITGDLTVSGGGKVKLASSYGASDGAIVTDGIVRVDGGGTFAGSGMSGSYPFLITTSACPAEPGCNGANAITLDGGAGTVAIIAQDGTAEIEGGSALKEVTAKQIIMTGGASLIYDSGLISANFSSGPGGSWMLIPGTYAITQ
jgi:hypothetical protein